MFGQIEVTKHSHIRFHFGVVFVCMYVRSSEQVTIEVCDLHIDNICIIHSCCNGGIEGQATRIGQEMNPDVQKMVNC